MGDATGGSLISGGTRVIFWPKRGGMVNAPRALGKAERERRGHKRGRKVGQESVSKARDAKLKVLLLKGWECQKE